MKIKNLAVVSLWAEDVPALAHFYAHVLELPLLVHHGERPHFRAGESIITILEGQPAIQEQPTRFPLLAFEVDDLDAAAEELKAQGVELPWGIEEDADSRWVMLRDPAGHLLEIAEFNLAKV